LSDDLNSTNVGEVAARAELREEDDGIDGGTGNEGQVVHADSAGGTRVDEEVHTGSKIGGDGHTEGVTTVVEEVETAETTGVEVDGTINTIELKGGTTTGTGRGSALEETVGHTRRKHQVVASAQNSQSEITLSTEDIGGGGGTGLDDGVLGVGLSLNDDLGSHSGEVIDDEGILEASLLGQGNGNDHAEEEEDSFHA